MSDAKPPTQQAEKHSSETVKESPAKVPFATKVRKILYDEWFKIIVGGAIVAVLTVWITNLMSSGDASGETTIAPALSTTPLSLGEIYALKASKSYVIASDSLVRDFTLSVAWKTGGLTTRDAATNEVIEVKTNDIVASVIPDGGQSHSAHLRVGTAFLAGKCDPDGITVTLMDKPADDSETFEIRVAKQTCLAP